MRGVIWLVVLFAAAVVAASALGSNDGLVSIYWRGWRTDLSLNLALLLLAGGAVVVWLAGQALFAMLRMPQQAREWRESRRSGAAQAALRAAQAEFLAARYSRAQRAAQRALELSTSTPELKDDHEFKALALVFAAGSAHRLQDRPERDRWLAGLRELPRAGAAGEGGALLAAEWALEDNDTATAQRLLNDLPLGVSRRTQALRLKLRAARQSRQPQQALHMARQLAKHQAFSEVAAAGLLRTLAIETLQTPRDAEQLRRAWQALDAADRRDPWVSARAAQRAVALEAHTDARLWLRPHWESLGKLDPHARTQVAMALMQAVPGIDNEWLARLEAAAAQHPEDSAVQAAVGAALFERQLWGRARRALDRAALDAGLAAPSRRMAWRLLAQLARLEEQPEREQQCLARAAAVD